MIVDLESTLHKTPRLIVEGCLVALGAEALRSASSVMEPITAPVKEFGIETMKAAQVSMEPYQGAVPSYKNIAGVQDALYYLSHGVGTLLPMVAMSIASGGVGAAAGKMLAKNYVKTLAERMALEGIPGEIINASVKQGLLRGIERGALLGGYASSLAMEAGSITAEKVKEGQDVEPLRVMMGAIPAAALDVLPQFSLAKRTGLLKRFGLSKAEAELAEEAVKKIPSSFLGRVGKEAGIQFLQEAPTEAMQSVFENWAAHKDLTSQESIDDFIDSFLIGGAGGALFGGIGGAIQRKPAPQQPMIPGVPPTLPPATFPGVTPPPVPTPALAPPPAPPGPVIPPQPSVIPTPVVEKPPIPIPGPIIPPLGEAGKAIVDNLYIGLFGALQKGEKTFSGVKDPVLTKAKPFYDAGLIKSPEDLQKIVNQNYPQELLRAPGEAIPPAPGPVPGETLPPPPSLAPSPEPKAPPVPPPSLGGPGWMQVGKQAEFYDDKLGRKRVGTVTDIIYQGDPPQPSSVTISIGMGKKQKTLDFKADQVNEPTYAVRKKEYFTALQGLPVQQKKEVVANSKQFDNLLIQHADLFVDPGYIDFAYSTAQSDRQRAIAVHDVLSQARAEAGKTLNIQDVYNPVRRAENLQVLKDYVAKERPGVTAPETQNVTAGLLPMGKNTVLKGGEWLDVSYDEETGKIILKDGRQFSVAPDEKIEVEQVRVPKEAGPRLPAPAKPEPRLGPTGKLLPEQARILEQIRKENPEEASRIEKGNVVAEIQKYEAERLGKSKQMRQGEMLPQPKPQEKLFSEREEGRLTAELTPDWTENLFTEKEYSSEKAVQFLAKNSPVIENRTLFQAFLSNKNVVAKLKNLPITIQAASERSGRGLKAYYLGFDRRIFIDEEFANSSKERLSGTFLEEIVHGLTHESMTPKDKFELMAMLNRAISSLPEKERAVARKKQPSYQHAYLKMAGLTSQGRAVYYSLTNIDEFLAGAIHHPEVRDFLKSIPEMEGIGKPTNLWDRFTQWMSRVIFGDTDHASLLRQVLERAGELIERPPDYQITKAEMAKKYLIAIGKPNLEALSSLSFPGNVAEDPEFDPYLGKHRLLLHITDPDLKRWKEVGVLPYWLAKEHPEFDPFLQTQERREEKRSELKTEKFKQKEPFTFLKGEELIKTERAIIDGDAEGRVWTDAKLTEKFNLSPEGIAAYKAVRATLDDIFNTNLDRAEDGIIENAKRSIESAFAKFTHKIEARKESEQKTIVLELLKTAHDLTLSDTETTHLETLLKEVKGATEAPLKTVKAKLTKIFNEILTEKDKQKLLADYESAYEKAQDTIGEIRQIIYNALGGDIEQKNLDEITKGLVLAYLRTERPANTLKELRDEFDKAKGYFPRDHGRGKYEVYVTKESFDEFGQPYTRVIWNRFFNQIEGTIAYKKLKQDPAFNEPGMEIGVRPHKEEPDSSFFRASLANLQRLTDNAIEELKQKGAISPELADQIKYQILYELSDQFKARGAARHFILRADFLIKGYKETGLNQVLNDYISGWSGMITKQDAAGEFLEHMKGISKDKPKLKNFAFQYTDNMLRNDENLDLVLGKMRGLVFTYFLGGSLRGAFVNSTQSFTMTIPWLAREVGWKGLKAETMVFKAGLDLAMGRLSETEKRLLEEAHTKGIAEAQYINTIIREAGDRFGKTLGRIVELLAKPFGFIESKNREIAALSYFRAKYPELLKTMSETEAYDEAFAGATDFINKTQFLMTKGNLPNWASGADIGSQFFRTAYTFRKFNHNYLLSLRNSFRGPDGKIALDVIGRSLAYVALLGGLAGLPFLDDLLDEWEKFFGQPVRRDIKRNLGAIGGPALEKMGMMGIPALLGIDISGSLKMGIPFVGGPSEAIFGVWSGLGQKFVRAKDSTERGEILRAIESASPAFVESILKAYRMHEYGATTLGGKILFDEKGRPIKMTGEEAAVQAFGFRPERIATMARTHREFANIESNFTDRRNDLYARFRLAKTGEERTSVIKDVQKFNMSASKYRGAIPLINATSLRKSFISRPEKKYLAFGAQAP